MTPHALTGSGRRLLGVSDYNLAIIENAIAHKEPDK